MPLAARAPTALSWPAPTKATRRYVVPQVRDAEIAAIHLYCMNYRFRSETLDMVSLSAALDWERTFTWSLSLAAFDDKAELQEFEVGA